MTLDEYKQYMESFSRKNGKGDIFDSTKEIISAGNTIPLDFYLIGYRNNEGNYIDNLGIPLIRVKTYRSPEMWLDFQKFVKKQLDDWVIYLNNTYRENTNGKLGFSLKCFKTLDFSVEDLVKNIMDGNDFLPGDNPEDLTDSLIVRLIPRVGRVYADKITQGSYLSCGVIDLFQEAVISNRYSALAHEIGHGIFGYDHHEERRCIMDPVGKPYLKYEIFCGECKGTLIKLVS